MSTTQPRKPTKRQVEKRIAVMHDKLHVLVTDYVISHGGRLDEKGFCRSDGEWSDLKLPTILGELRVSVNLDWIACRFDEPKRAVTHFGTYGYALCQYSGKWNWGCGERADADELFSEWSAGVERILPEGQR